MVDVKILSIQYPERYAVRRLVTAAQQELLARCPTLENLSITEIADPTGIGKYARVLVLPSLVINEKLVCSGRLPTKEEVMGWLQEAAEKTG
ncbi:MAG: thioredoxin family protein [Anaerolineales bacterium]